MLVQVHSNYFLEQFLGTCILLTRGDISTGCTTPLVTGVVIGIIGALVGATGVIITCVTVKWR